MKESILDIKVKQSYLVPTGMCDIILKEKNKTIAFKAFAVLMYLKSISSGQLRITPLVRSHAYRTIGQSILVFNKSMIWLQKRKWVGHNQRTGIYYLRSWKTIKDIEGIESRSSYWFYVQWLEKCKEFVISVCLSELIKLNKRRTFTALVEKRWSTHQKAAKRALPLFYPISNQAFGKIFGFSQKTASIYKRLAVNAGMIEIRKNLIQVKIKHDAYRFFISAQNLSEHFIIQRDGKIYIQRPDLCRSLLHSKPVRIKRA